MTVNVEVIKTGNEYGLQVTEGLKTAKIPLPGCESEKDAEVAKKALLAEIDAAQIQQATAPAGVGNKMDRVV